MDRTDNSLLESVDARTRLAGSNRMEILLFSLGTREIFGINVFKVREVTRTPMITRSPNMPPGVEGVGARQRPSPRDGPLHVLPVALPSRPRARISGVRRAPPRSPRRWPPARPGGRPRCRK